MNREKKLKVLESLKTLLPLLEKLNKLEKQKNKRKVKRSCGVRPINRDRKIHGFFEVEFLNAKETDEDQFFHYTNMTPTVYDLLLNFLEKFMQKRSLREPISPQCRLAVTLLYLSKGDPFKNLAASFKLGKETVRMIVLETVDLICKKLLPVYVAEPNAEVYKQTAEDFMAMWNIPNCIGVIGGKHIAIQNQQKNAIKKLSSLVLLAVCDAKYRFMNVEVGAYGDGGGILQASEFGKKLLNNLLPIPYPEYLPDTQIKIPHFFVGDSAFPLACNLMRPYAGTFLTGSKQVFNKCLSQVLQVNENAFGILVSRWKVLLGILRMFPEYAEKVILACVALHNFILFNDSASDYIPAFYADWEDCKGVTQDGLWREEVPKQLESISPSANIHQYGGKSSTNIRNALCMFLS